MLKSLKKVLAIVLSCILMTGTSSFTHTSISAEELTVSQMIADASYNVALNKTATVYPNAVEGNPSFLVNGVLGAQDAAEHVSISQPGFNYYGESYATIDLGAVYTASTIDRIVVQYRYGTVNVGTATVVGKAYSVQYSVDGIDFTTVASTESATLDGDRMTYDDVSATEGIVRYVRIYYPQTVQYSMQLLEIAVLDTNGDLAESSGAKVEDITNLIVTDNKDNSINVQFEPSVTENVRYAIYVDGQMKLNNAVANAVNRIEDLSVGNHTVMVKAIDGTGITSKGVSQHVIVTGIAPAEEVVNNELYNLALNAPVTVQTLREGNASHITNGKIGAKTETGDYGAVNTPGYVQIELAKAYPTEVINEIDIWYRSSNPGLMPINVGYEIQFSSDGTDFVTIKSVTKENMPSQPADQNDIYTTKDNMKEAKASTLIDKVKYVRVVYNGSIAWGAQIRELAVFDMSGNGGETEGEKCEITIDGQVVDTVEKGEKYTLSSDAKYGYYADGVMYKGGTTITITNNMEFTSVNELSAAVAQGAGIRVDGTSGIRFQATVTTDNEEALASDAITEGMLITANDLYVNFGELTKDCGYTKLDVKNSGWYAGKVGTYCGSIVNIAKSNYIRKFIARAYLTITYSDGSTATVYSGMTGARSIQGVAEAVVKAGYPNLSAKEKELVDAYAATK